MCRRGSTSTTAARSSQGARATSPPSDFPQTRAPGVRDSNTCADCNPKASQEPGADPTAHVAPQGLPRATSEAIHPLYSFFVLAPLPLPLSLGCLQCRQVLGLVVRACDPRAAAGLLAPHLRHASRTRGCGDARPQERVRRPRIFRVGLWPWCFCASVCAEPLWRYCVTINK